MITKGQYYYSENDLPNGHLKDSFAHKLYLTPSVLKASSVEYIQSIKLGTFVIKSALAIYISIQGGTIHLLMRWGIARLIQYMVC